jgi:methylase of polypeptide subunit release factors
MKKSHTGLPKDTQKDRRPFWGKIKVFKRSLRFANRLVRTHLFCRKKFIHWVFGIRVVAPSTVHSYCEWGTILQRLILRKYIRRGDCILDLGTGAHALIAVFAAKRFPGVKVVATDILPDRVSMARETATANRVNISCLATDLFEGLTDEYDLVLFNPPPIPSNELAELGYTLKSYPGLGARRCWTSDGGSDGMHEIRRFINTVGNHLTERGRAMVCVNPVYCDRTIIQNLCRESGLTLECIYTLLGFTNAYVMAPGNSQTNDKQG